MSYSNGLLESTSTRIIEGIPGVGFKLTENGNYDMEIKKLTNLKPGTDDGDFLTKKQIYDHVKGNGGAGKAIDLTDYLKKDGSDEMNGLLNMNSRRIENLANPRSGEADGIPYEYFRQWYMDFDDNNIKINVENPINMKNKNKNN